jgi:ABC-type polysaccharide/polyol phosphate export permease
MNMPNAMLPSSRMIEINMETIMAAIVLLIVIVIQQQNKKTEWTLSISCYRYDSG